MITGYVLAGILAIVLPLSLGCLIAWGIWGRPKGDHHFRVQEVKPVGTREYWAQYSEPMTDDEWLTSITEPYTDDEWHTATLDVVEIDVYPELVEWEAGLLTDHNPDWAVKLAWETVQWQAEQAAALATWKQEMGITSETT